MGIRAGWLVGGVLLWGLAGCGAETASGDTAVVTVADAEVGVMMDAGVELAPDAATADADAPDAIADAGLPDAAPRPATPVAPVYAGTCPTFIEGVNGGFESGGLSRTLRVQLPDDPEGAPVLFAWHWLGGTAGQITAALDLAGFADREGVIVVAPESAGSPYEWAFDQGPEQNADLALFDDVLGCLDQQFGVDMDRIHATGFSAGGLWTSYLTMHRAGYLASTAPMSGGVNRGIYSRPESPIPVLLIWGGPDDSYRGVLNFQTTSLIFSELLREDGHFVAHCVHDGRHTLPPDAMALVWRWLAVHPRGVTPLPYADGLTDDYPGWCTLP